MPWGFRAGKRIPSIGDEALCDTCFFFAREEAPGTKRKRGSLPLALKRGMY